MRISSPTTSILWNSSLVLNNFPKSITYKFRTYKLWWRFDCSIDFDFITAFRRYCGKVLVNSSTSSCWWCWLYVTYASSGVVMVQFWFGIGWLAQAQAAGSQRNGSHEQRMNIRRAIVVRSRDCEITCSHNELPFRHSNSTSRINHEGFVIYCLLLNAVLHHYR